MFMILKEVDANETAALERLRVVVDGPLREACRAWMDAAEAAKLGLGQGDDFVRDVVWHLQELDDLLSIGRLPRTEDEADLASGEIVPMVNVDGTPVTRCGKQLYERAARARWLEEIAIELADWLVSTPPTRAETDRLRALEHLREIEARDGTQPPDERDFIARSAATLAARPKH